MEIEKGKWIKDDDESKKVQGIQFEKIIKGILDSKFYGYSLIEILEDVVPENMRIGELLPDDDMIRIY